MKKISALIVLVSFMMSCMHHGKHGGCGGCQCDSGKSCAMDSKDTTKKSTECDNCKKGN